MIGLGTVAIILGVFSVFIALSGLIPPFVIKDFLVSLRTRGLWRYVAPIIAGILFHYLTPLPAIAGSIVFLISPRRRESLTKLSNALKQSDPARALGPEWEGVFRDFVQGRETLAVKRARARFPITSAVLCAIAQTRNPEQIAIIKSLLQSAERESASIRTQIQSLLVAKAVIPISATFTWYILSTNQLITQEMSTLALIYQLAAVLVYELGISWIESMSPTV